jgi:hypothetical protein
VEIWGHRVRGAESPMLNVEALLWNPHTALNSAERIAARAAKKRKLFVG